MTVEVFIATSIDGFIARPNGSIDWLANPKYMIEGEDYGYAEFIATVGCILMGSGTCDVVSRFDDWPYNVPVYVLSNRLKELPKHLEGKAFLRSGELQGIIAELKKTHAGVIYIDGGKLIQSGLRAGLIDRMCISRIPVLLGEGLTLFGPVEADIALTHKETKCFESGITKSIFDVRR